MQQCVECGELLCDDCIEEGCCSITPANVEDIDEEPGEPDYNAVSSQERAEMDYEQKYYGRNL